MYIYESLPDYTNKEKIYTDFNHSWHQDSFYHAISLGTSISRIRRIRPTGNNYTEYREELEKCMDQYGQFYFLGRVSSCH